MRAALLSIPLAACSAGGGYMPQGCEPGSPVRAVVGGVAEAGFSDRGFVSDSDIDLTVGVTTGGSDCR